jgi:hypothetical protein
MFDIERPGLSPGRLLLMFPRNLGSRNEFAVPVFLADRVLNRGSVIAIQFRMLFFSRPCSAAAIPFPNPDELWR